MEAELEAHCFLTSPNLREKSFASFEKMRSGKQLCDISIRVGQVSISAHRLILGAAVPYFRDRLSERVVKLTAVEPEAVACLIDYAYTCEVYIGTSNVKSLLAAASLLEIEEVKQACCDFLSDGLEPETAWNVRDLAIRFKCSTLWKKADRYISENFVAISLTRDFVNYHLTYLIQLIDKDDLNVENEVQVLDAVLRWVKESPEDRKNDLPEFLRRIRMPLMEPVCLKKIVETEGLIRESSLCRNLIDEAEDYNLLSEKRPAVCSFKTQPRRKKKHVNQIPCIHQLESVEIYTTQLYDILQDRWIIENTTTFENVAGSAVHLQNKMYYFYLYTTLQYDPKDRSLNDMRSMPTLRDCVGATVLKDRIYICGGRVGGVYSPSENDIRTTNVVECFDPADNTWSAVREMLTSRYGLSAVTLGECIFAIGGKCNGVTVGTVEKYDPKNDMWTTISSMAHQRRNASAATLSGKIYVCGGRSLDGDPIRSCEMYDPRDDLWLSISPLNSARHNFVLLSFEQKLYAIGGDGIDNVRLRTFDVYDPESDTWTLRFPANSDLVTSGAAVMAVVDALPEMALALEKTS